MVHTTNYYLTQQEQRRIRMTAIIILAAATISIVAVNCTNNKVNGQSALSLESPPLALPLNGTDVTLTGDEKDRDININPNAFLPANGTQSISTAGATDMDINVFPNQGISVIIQNETITVTNHPVTIQGAAAAAPAAATGGDNIEEDSEEE